AAWSIRNTIVLGSSTNRVIAFHPVWLSHLVELARTIGSWLFISDKSACVLPALATVIVLVVLIAGAIIARRRGEPVMIVVLRYVLAIGATLAWSISFVDFHTPLDERI